MEGLLYLLFSGFVQANKSHTPQSFQLIRINPSGGDWAGQAAQRSWVWNLSNYYVLTQAVGALKSAPSELACEAMTFQLVRINPSGGVRTYTKRKRTLWN